MGQKPPSAKRCIKTGIPSSKKRETSGQKAPSVKRCIKTSRFPSSHTNAARGVRKHRAPKGALRRACSEDVMPLVGDGQKAPSAKRCIKTLEPRSSIRPTRAVRKHRAPKGALRQRDNATLTGHNHRVRKHRAPNGALRHTCQRTRGGQSRSESTKRQKVH